MRIFTVHSQKGGVGKTMISIALAYHLTEKGEKTILIDADLTGSSVLDVLKRQAGPETDLAIHQKKYKNRLGDTEKGEKYFLNHFLFANPRTYQDFMGVSIEINEKVDRLIWKTDDLKMKTNKDGEADKKDAEEKEIAFDFIPSSAYPDDVRESWNAVMRNDHLGFLSQRFKDLLVRLLSNKHGGQYTNVVIDTSPTLYGLSGEFIRMFSRKSEEEYWNLEFEGIRRNNDVDKPKPWDEKIWTPIVVSTNDANDLSAFSKNIAGIYAKYLEKESCPFVNVYNKVMLNLEAFESLKQAEKIYDLIRGQYLTTDDISHLESVTIPHVGSEITLLQYLFKERSVAIQETESRRKAYKNQVDLRASLWELSNDDGFKELFKKLELE